MSQSEAKPYKACDDPWVRVYLQSDGQVVPCCHAQTRMGDLADDDLDAIWSGDRFETFRRFLLSPTPLPVCRDCFIRGWRERPILEDEALSAAASSAEPTVLRPSIAVNRTSYAHGDRLTMRIGLEVDGVDPDRRVDVSVWGVLPDGQCQYVHNDGRRTLLAPEPRPLLLATGVFSFAHLEVLHIPVNHWLPGAYSVHVALTTPGADPQLPDERLAFATAAFVVV